MTTSLRTRAASLAITLTTSVALVLGIASPAAASKIHPGNATLVMKSIGATAGVGVGRTATCPTGDRAITGGAYWHRPHMNGDPALAVELTASTPTLDATGWYAAGISSASETLVLTVLVQCLPSASFPAYAVRTRDVPVDQYRPGNAMLRCPANDRVVTGGGAWHLPGKPDDPALDGMLTGTWPDLSGTSWSATGTSFEAQTVKLRVIALCLPATAFGAHYTTLGDTHQAAGPAEFDEYIHCPSGLHSIGGGMYWTYPHNPAFPATESWATLRSVSTTGDDSSLYVGGLAFNQRTEANMDATMVETCTDA